MTSLARSDGQIDYTDSGTGDPPIVFVHGYGCAHEDWAHQIVHFGEDHRVLALDQRGHGRSRGFSSGFDIEHLGADLGALVASAGAGPSVLVGHSMGCRVVLETYRVTPDRVSALVLVDGSRFSNRERPAAEQASRDAIAAVGFPAFIESAFRGMFVGDHDRDTVDRAIDRALGLGPEAGTELFAQLAGWDAGRMIDALSRVQVPLLVIQSTYVNDRRERVSLGPGDTTPWLDLLRAHAPRAEIEILDGLGHFNMREAPERFNRCLAAWLGRQFG